MTTAAHLASDYSVLSTTSFTDRLDARRESNTHIMVVIKP